MPHEVRLPGDRPTVGYALDAAPGEGHQIRVASTEFTSSEDGELFVSRLEGLPQDLLFALPPEERVEPSMVDHLVGIIRKDMTATVYVNECTIRAQVRSARAIEAGEPVIVVDDLDRLRRQEIRDLVALVKLNADLPNLHFVLAYDRDRVEQALGETEEDGRAYLEKIVQVTYDVPKSRDVDLSQELLDAMNEVLGHAAVTGPFDEHRFGSIRRKGRPSQR